MPYTTELDRALHRFAVTYMNTGADWDEACDAAEAALAKVRREIPSLSDPRDIAWQIDAEAYRYADM
jgi:hypothetical protein